MITSETSLLRQVAGVALTYSAYMSVCRATIAVSSISSPHVDSYEARSAASRRAQTVRHQNPNLTLKGEEIWIDLWDVIACLRVQRSFYIY
jgi:hypothetical protein